MSINKESQKAPNLRFKGFTDDWEQRKLKDVSERVRGNDGRMELPTLTISAGKGWLDQRDRFSGNIAGKEQKNYTLLSENELSYNKGNSKLAKYGVVFKLSAYKEALVPRVYHSFRTNKEANPDYIEYMFATKLPDRELGKLVTSGARMDGLLNINYDDFIGIKIKIPSLAEQSKISILFIQLDNLITLHQRKLDQLNQLKAALLQQMFPGKGETVPKLRFAGFEGDWEERKLGEMVGTISSGNRLPKSELTKGNVPYIVAQTKNNGVFGYISENTKDYNGNDMKLFPSNSISFSIDNPEAIFYRNEPFYTSNIMRVIHNETLREFDYIFIIESMKMFTKSYDWSRKFSGPIVSNLKIMFPMDNEEQLKIGQFFKQLDNTITLQQRKLEQLQDIKQVLLQNMFI